MDWENKQFHQETVLQAPREAVIEAMHRFAAQTLPDWSVDSTPEGFEARGESALHHAVAHFRISQVANGTKVDVELVVRRASSGPLGGFMLFDVGGYYDSQIRKWLWTIWNLLADVNADPRGNVALIAPQGTMAPNAIAGARVVVMDAHGKPYLGVVREVTPTAALVAYDEGGEKWVPATAVHVVERRDDL